MCFLRSFLNHWKGCQRWTASYVTSERVEELWTLKKNENRQTFIILKEDKRSILVTFWFYNVKFDSLLQMYTGLCIETYGKDKILWKWQTAFLKIYMLVVLWLYFHKIMTRCQCLKSILFWGIIFSDSLLERIIL